MEEVLFPATPANLANFGQAVNFSLIVGLALILFGVATLVVSMTRRRRETGLLKALGFVAGRRPSLCSGRPRPSAWPGSSSGYRSASSSAG